MLPFLRGEGGRAVPTTPSAMWLSRVACTGCHLALPGFEEEVRFPVKAREFACMACHGPGFQGMLGSWQARYSTTARRPCGTSPCVPHRR